MIPWHHREAAGETKTTSGKRQGQQAAGTCIARCRSRIAEELRASPPRPSRSMMRSEPSPMSSPDDCWTNRDALLCPRPSVPACNIYLAHLQTCVCARACACACAHVSNAAEEAWTKHHTNNYKEMHTHTCTNHTHTHTHTNCNTQTHAHAHDNTDEGTHSSAWATSRVAVASAEELALASPDACLGRVRVQGLRSGVAF